MKAAVLHGPRDLRVEEIEDPKLTPDGAILKVKACGICGGDLPWYEKGGFPGSRSVEGHEWSGEVVEVGANVARLKVGDRLAMGGYGAYAEYFGMPNAGGGFMMPDDMSYEVGATVEPMSIGLALAMKTEPQVGDSLAVLGAGAIGQGTMQAFKAMGVGKTIITDLEDSRLEVAKILGADTTINAAKENVAERISEATSGMGADIVAICCDAAEATNQAFEVVRGGGLYRMQVMGADPATVGDAMSFGGKVGIVAGFAQQMPSAGLVIQKSLRVVGNWGGRMSQAFELVRTGRVKTEPLITHGFPLDDITEAFETALKRDMAMKVMINP